MRINELAINNEQLPRYFWVVLDIPTFQNDGAREKKMLSDLSSCRLSGIRGISDTKQILTSWFGVARNAAIFLDPTIIERYNDIEQIPYNDPNALCAGNLKLLRRIFNKEGPHKYNASGTMQNIAQYVQGAAKNIDINLHHTLQYHGQTLISDLWGDNPQGIDNLDDLVDFFIMSFSTLHKETLPRDLIAQAVYKGMRRIGSTYSDEGEWIVHSPELTYPVGCTMLVGCDMESKTMHAEWVAAGRPENDGNWFSRKRRIESIDRLLTTIEEYKLDKSYKIKFVDMDKWTQMRDKLWDKRKR